MAKNSIHIHQRLYSIENIMPGIIIGGLVGILIGFLHRAGILVIPGFNTIFSAIPLNVVFSGALLGIIIGGLISAFTITPTNNVSTSFIPRREATKIITKEDNTNVTLKLKAEELDIAKEWIKIGDVKLYRKTITEDKLFFIPVIREELVVEKKKIDFGDPINENTETEIIRIPLSEEHVDFTKHKVVLEDVTIYKKYIKDIKHVEETIKREEADIRISGSPNVKDESELK